MRVIWHLWAILSFSSCTGWQALSFAYLYATLSEKIENGPFGGKMGAELEGYLATFV